MPSTRVVLRGSRDRIEPCIEACRRHKMVCPIAAPSCHIGAQGISGGARVRRLQGVVIGGLDKDIDVRGEWEEALYYPACGLRSNWVVGHA